MRTAFQLVSLTAMRLLLLVLLWTPLTLLEPMPLAAFTWRADVGGAVYSSPIFSPSGDVYVSSYDGNMYSIAANGSRTWRVFLGPLYYSPLFVQHAIASAVSRSPLRSTTEFQYGAKSGSEFSKLFAGYNNGGGGLGVVASVGTDGRVLSQNTFTYGSLQCGPQYPPPHRL